MVQEDPHYIPIPYPRFFTESLISYDGLLTPKGYKKKDFLQCMPSVQKLLLDGQYLGHCEESYKRLKTLSSKTRFNLMRENDNMEDDEWREKVHALNVVCEHMRQLALGEDPSLSDGDDSYDYDY